MRPGQNKRMRGRSNNSSNRKGPNPLTRSYESNGPDVKIRGTAHHIGEKYLQLARDAQSSGDPVMAESYLQHAEHYFRLIAAAQQQLQQSQFGYQRPAGEQIEVDDDIDDDFTSLPDRFASPSERAPQPQPPVPQPYVDRPPYSDRQPGFNADRPPQERQGQERQGHERSGQDRQGQDRQGQDRQGQERPPHQGYDRQGGERAPHERYEGRSNQERGERPPYEPRERTYDNRRDRPYQDRNGGYDRNAPDRNGERNPQERPPNSERNSDAGPREANARGGQDRGGQDRGGPDRGGPERPGQERGTREYDNRGYRNRRDYREAQPREPRQPSLEETSNGLPAFITAPARIPTEPEPTLTATEAEGPEATEDAAYHLRPRRRRRPKGEFAGDVEGRNEAPATDPVSD